MSTQTQAIPRRPHFDGKTYDPALDCQRLKSQLGRVFVTLLDGQWHTLREISQATGDPEASVSARIRDFRKGKFGGYTVNHRRTDTPGVWEYQLASEPPSTAKQLDLL